MDTITRVSTDTEPIHGPARSPVLRAQLLAGVVVAVAVALQAPADAFLFDAADYWGGARALLEGGDVGQVGLLNSAGR